MPGNIITDHRVHKFKQLLPPKPASASEAPGVSKQAKPPPSQRVGRAWRTPEDALSVVWDSKVIPLLGTDARLHAVTLLDELQRRYPPGQRDTSVRRPCKAAYACSGLSLASSGRSTLRRNTPQRLQGISDFTLANKLNVEIAGVTCTHRLYQFALTYSSRRHITVIDFVEDFMALSTALQAALWALESNPGNTVTTACRRIEQFDRTRRVAQTICSPVQPLRPARNALQPQSIQ